MPGWVLWDLTPFTGSFGLNPDSRCRPGSAPRYPPAGPQSGALSHAFVRVNGRFSLPSAFIT
jgi:hypothetical protein